MGKLLDDAKHVQAIIGVPNSLLGCSRPDIAYAVGKFAQKASKPNVLDMKAANRVLTYLRDITSRSLRFKRSCRPGESHIKIFVASAFGNEENRRNVYGYLVMLNNNVIHCKAADCNDEYIYDLVRISSFRDVYSTARNNLRKVAGDVHDREVIDCLLRQSTSHHTYDR